MDRRRRRGVPAGRANHSGGREMANDGSGGVVPMAQAAGYSPAAGRPDVRGWPVMSADGKQLGEVADVLVDAGAGVVRYLEVDLDDTLLVEDPDRHVLLPVGCAHVDGQHVVADALSARDLPMLPPYGGTLTAEMETSVRAAFTHMRGGTARAGTASIASFYNDACFDENRFFSPPPAREEVTQQVADTRTAAPVAVSSAGIVDAPPAAPQTLTGTDSEGRLTLVSEELNIATRPVDIGAVQVNKRVETEHVVRTVPTIREEVVIERRPVPEGTMPTARIEGDDVIIPLYEEELVIEKRMVAREELVVRKRHVTVEQTVEADLRRERADVHQEGDVRVHDHTAGDPRPRDGFTDER
jgi:photosynthetic reaction center H subunit